LKLALKIDVDSLRGTREGVPRLVEMLQRHGAGATFFFSLGPDHTSALRRATRAIPAPDIGRRCPDVLRAVRDAGFEVGIHAWDSAVWQAGVVKGDADWTARQMALAMARFEEIFGERATVRAAPGWKMNKHAWRNTQALGFDYAADTCGTHPFVPVVRAEIIACPQVPTTLPSLDEWIGREGVTEETVVERLLALTAAAHIHVYAARATSEGRRRAPAFERLLEGWKAQGYELVTLRDVLATAAAETLPMHAVLEGNVPDRRNSVTLQGPEFLAQEGSSAA
jgi:undecaprenyl phosphate-alpha-L-ara4FN deformylase